MEESIVLKNRKFIGQVENELLGGPAKQKIVMRINSKNLTKNGEICFPANLLAWKDILTAETSVENCSNILEYYLRRKTCGNDELSKQEILKKAEELLIAASEIWPMGIEKCLLQKDTVCLFLQRNIVIESVIKSTLRCGVDYGKKRSAGRRVCLKVSEDEDSELTTSRLHLIKGVSERVLCLKGYEISDQDPDLKYSLTTRSQGSVEDNYRRCICGVVKNQASNSKEKSLTWSMYVEGKTKELSRLAESKVTECNNGNEEKKVSETIVAFELLSVKPSRPVSIQTNEDPGRAVSSPKGGSFVLYNTARISAILQKFKEEECLGHYPSLPKVDEVDFSLLNQEEEWELVYNFILGYPEMIEDSVVAEESLETSPHMVCLFLSRLSQKFSIYYRRTRILTEGRVHLVPTMMARLCLLRALQVVVNNSLALLNITPVTRM